MKHERTSRIVYGFFEKHIGKTATEIATLLNTKLEGNSRFTFPLTRSEMARIYRWQGGEVIPTGDYLLAIKELSGKK